MGKFDFTFWSTLAVAIFAFLATVIGVIYTRNSYILTLRTYEKDKSRGQKAKHYYETYINKPPSHSPSVYLKKIDSDDLNENVILPSTYTDFLIKNYPDNYFYLASRLRNCHKNFVLMYSNLNEKPICKVKHFNLLVVFYFILYLFFAMCGCLLVFGFSNIVSSFSVDNFWGILFLTSTAVIAFFSLMLLCLFKTTQVNNTRTLIKDLNLKRITYKDDLLNIKNWFINIFNYIKKMKAP